MEKLSETDLRKIELIRIYERVGCLVDITRTIDKGILVGALAGILPEDRDSFMYRIMEHTLEYKNKVDEELEPDEKWED